MSLAGLDDTVSGRKEYVRRLDEIAVAREQGAGLVDDQSCRSQSTLRRGWYWDSQEFRERILDLYGKVVPGKKNRDYRSSEVVEEHGIH